jgi:hypothetical protein
VPTVFENLITTIPSPLDPSKYIELALWDTAGQEDFDRLRPLSYNDTDVILVVFACNHRPSLMNVQDKVSTSACEPTRARRREGVEWGTVVFKVAYSGREAELGVWRALPVTGRRSDLDEDNDDNRRPRTLWRAVRYVLTPP